MNTRYHQSGMTLLELLVAIGLAALVSVLGYRGLDTLLRSREELSRRHDELAAISDTWRWLARDLSHLIPNLTTTNGVRRLQVAADVAGIPVLMLAVAENIMDDTKTEGLRHFSVVYRISDGHLERTEQVLVPDSGQAIEIGRIALATADHWQLAYWLGNVGWANAMDKNAQATTTALHVSLALSGLTYTRAFTIQP